MNDQSKEDEPTRAKRKIRASKKPIGKKAAKMHARFHFTVDADSPEINVTVAPIDLKLPPAPWPDWPKPQPNP